MAAGVVTVGRHRYAVGLYWENSPGSGRVAQIAKEAAEQPGQQADFYVVRPGNKDGRVPQFGLCSSEAGQTAGMPVLAACLAGQIPGSWAGAFRLNEGVVVIIVRDDLIVPDGDLFYTEEADARDRLIQEIGFGGLQSIYAPESWSIPGADTIPLTLLLNDHVEIKLQRVTVSIKTKLGLLAGVAVFALLVGLVLHFQEQSNQKKLQEIQAQALKRLPSTAVPTFAQQPPPKPEYDRKWEKAPPVIAVVKACADGLARVPSAQAGWTLSALSCSGTSLSLTWARGKGETVPPNGANVNETGTTATQVIPLGALQPRGSETLRDIPENTNRYLAQVWPGTISRAPDDPLPPPPPGYNGEWNPPPAPWVKRSFTLRVPQLPGGLPEYIGDLPGAIINNMNAPSANLSAGWTVEGVIYENRK